MKKVIKLKESDLLKLIKSKLQEEVETKNYMFFGNLEQIKRQIEELESLPKDVIDNLLQNGHDWADDHISKAKENIDHVYEFFMNELSSDDMDMEQDILTSDMTEGRKKTGTKLCARGKSAAKAKYDVYPSAYANGYAVQVCKGKQPGLDGKKRCSSPYC
jgi:septation ring formation regulator EzrA